MYLNRCNCGSPTTNDDGICCGCRNKQEEEFNEEEFNEMIPTFTGTLEYHRSTFGRLNLTDGVDYVREKLKCFWLIDIIESTQHLKKIKEHSEFIVWQIMVFPNKKFEVTAWTDSPNDSRSVLLYKQEGDYTDFKLNSFEIWQENNVLLLAGEH